MRRLLSKTEQRKLALVEFLYNKPEYVKFTELSKEMATSERNIRENLQDLKELTNMMTIDIHSEMVKLSFHKNMGMEALTRHFIKNNFSFNLLERLFFYDHLHLDKLAEELYVSPSTLYRYFNKIEEIIGRDFNLWIETNPCQVMGDENNIRDFYITFFSEKYGVFEWPFDCVISSDLSERLIDDVLEALDLDFDFSFRRHMRFVFAIGLTRYQKKNYLNQNLSPRKINIVERIEKITDKEKYEKLLNKEIDKHFLYEMFTPFLNDNVLYTSAELVDSANENQTISKNYFKLLNIFRTLSNKYKVPIEDQDAVIVGVHSTFYLGSSEPYAHFLIYDKKKEFLDNVARDFPHFYKDLKEHVIEFFNQTDTKTDDKLLNHMIYTFMTHWRNLFTHLNKTKPKYKIYVISNNDREHSLMLKEVLETEFTNQLDITIGKDTRDIKNICPGGEYDLVVTNFPFEEVGSTPLVCVENYPTKNDMLLVRNELMLVSNKYQLKTED